MKFFIVLISFYLSAASQSKPNIILCMADDMGWGDTSYNGHPVLRTPHLDQMAEEGLRFNRFYASSPVCSPTRASCLTGRHPFRYGITFANTGRLEKEEITLPEILKKQGYKTGHFGKWHLGALTTKVKDAHRGRPNNQESYSPPWEHGYDECFVTESAVPTFWKEGVYQSYGTSYWTGMDQQVKEEILGDSSKLILDRTLPFIERSVAEKVPFLAVIWFHAPHMPVVSASPYTDAYAEHEDKEYYGAITGIDIQMGRLRQHLNKLGIEENTMIWFCSDNGPSHKPNKAGQTKNLRARKRSLYEGGVRVPGLLVWPAKIRQARHVDMPCSTMDYLPTILEILGEQDAIDRPLDGISLVPLIENKMNNRPKAIAFESCISMLAARKKDYSKNEVALIEGKYKIYSKDSGKTIALFDLEKDPSEKVDLSNELPEIKQKLINKLISWRQSCRESASGQNYK